MSGASGRREVPDGVDALEDVPQSLSAPRLFIGLTESWAKMGQTPSSAARVEQRLAARLLERYPDLAVFCVYEGAAGGFVALSRADADTLLDGRMTRRPPAVGGRPQRRGRLERYLVGPTRRRLRPVLRGVPDALQAPLYRFLISARIFVSATFGAAAAVVAALSRSAAERHRQDRQATIEFAARDVLVLSSVAEDQPGLFSCLYRHKRASGLTLVVYCHDASALDRPQLVPPDQLCLLQESYVDMVWSAASIVCASECTRAALRRFIATVGLPARPLGVIHPGIDPPASPSGERPVALPPVQPGRFALVVGGLGPAGNHQLLYDLWIRLADEMPDRLIPLLFVGDPGWLAGDLIGTIRDDRRLHERLLILSGLPDEALGWLYRNCAFTLYPSFAGGWPRPVVESLALGKYCVASTAPANAELSQGLLDLLDPLDFMAWQGEVGRLLTDPGYLSAKERRIAAFRPRAWASAGDELAAEIAACMAAGASP